MINQDSLGTQILKQDSHLPPPLKNCIQIAAAYSPKILQVTIKLKKTHFGPILGPSCPENPKQAFCQNNLTKFSALRLL